MTSDDRTEMQKWMEARFDRLDDKLQTRSEALEREIVNTRHNLRPVIEQIAIQVAANVTATSINATAIAAINEWRAEEGPLDRRLKRHSARADDVDRWRHTLRGALIAVSFFVPIVTGIVVGVVLLVARKAVGAE